MRIAIYSENLLGNSGGAEIYAIKLAECFMEKHDVSIITVRNNKTISMEQLKNKYSIKDFRIQTINFSHKSNNVFEIFNRIILREKLKKIINNNYDVFINCSHNRLISFPKVKSIHVIHFPMKNYCSFLPNFLGNILNKKYSNSYDIFLSNSEFTQFHLKKEWKIDSDILNPPIEADLFASKDFDKKQKLILMVGRLVPDKKILEIVDFLSPKLNNEYLKDYELTIIGNKDSNNLDYYEKLKVYENNKINIISDVSFSSLVNFYKKAEIFIHAKGFQEDENQNPILMEHFGMTTVEAMANGCIPVVINKAGQKEIVTNGVSGFLWNDLNELDIELQRIISSEKLKNSMRENVLMRASGFLIGEFNKKAMLYLNKLTNIE